MKLSHSIFFCMLYQLQLNGWTDNPFSQRVWQAMHLVKGFSQQLIQSKDWPGILSATILGKQCSQSQCFADNPFSQSAGEITLSATVLGRQPLSHSAVKTALSATELRRQLADSKQIIKNSLLQYVQINCAFFSMLCIYCP